MPFACQICPMGGVIGSFTIHQGDINFGASSQANFILNYFLSNFLKFPLKFSISSQPGWKAGTTNVTLVAFTKVYCIQLAKIGTLQKSTSIFF